MNITWEVTSKIKIMMNLNIENILVVKFSFECVRPIASLKKSGQIELPSGDENR